MSPSAPRPAITLGWMREHGIRTVDLFCPCGHESLGVNADRWNDRFEVPQLASKFRCSKCGALPKVRPNWAEHNAQGRL